MLQPKRTKYRKAFKGRIKGNAKGGTTLNFGSVGLKAMEPERVTARQIEAARRAISRHIKRTGRMWIRVFPDVPVSKKPTEVRMGKDRGSCGMKARDLTGKTKDELNDQLEALKKEQFNLRFQRATGQLESTARVQQVRRDIARVKTVLRAAGVRA